MRLLQTKVQPANKIKRKELQGLKAVLLLVYGALVFFVDEETFAEVKFLISRKAQTYCILWKIHERISEFKGFFYEIFPRDCKVI